MGTRGFVGFVADGTEKIGYNHFDSYPDGLGNDVLAWLREVTVEGRVVAVKAAIRQLKVVTEETPPTEQEIAQLKRWADRVGWSRLDDWYVLLRETQGDPAAILEAGYIEDWSEFPLDSLFAEWGYVVDFDQEMFEVHRGFQAEPHGQGRFARPLSPPNSSGYHPVRLIAEWPFASLPTKDELVRFDHNGVD